MTASNSRIVLAEGLAPMPIAKDLLQQLPQYAPNLLRYLDQPQHQSQRQVIDVDRSKCLAIEHWQLEQAGFVAKHAKHNAALALLLASQQEKYDQLAADKPFWLVELVHLSPARDGATLIPSSELHIQAEQNATLLQAAQSLCEGTPFLLEPWSDTHWQLHDQSGALPAHFASSALVSRTAVNDWWEHDESSRPWRRFVNEIQMLFFNEASNQSRQAQGLLPINSLWPVGGIAPTQWQPQPTTNTTVFTQLSAAYLRQDWGLWLQQWQEIDATITPLLNSASAPHIILTNTEHYLSVSPQSPSLWQRVRHALNPKRTPSWRTHCLTQS